MIPLAYSATDSAWAAGHSIRIESWTRLMILASYIGGVGFMAIAERIVRSEAVDWIGKLAASFSKALRFEFVIRPKRRRLPRGVSSGRPDLEAARVRITKAWACGKVAHQLAISCCAAGIAILNSAFRESGPRPYAMPKLTNLARIRSSLPRTVSLYESHP